MMREKLSELEHEQWEFWTKAIASELQEVRDLIKSRNGMRAVGIINKRLKRWEDEWVPYAKLSEEVKDSDRVWADKVLAIVEKKNGPSTKT